MMNRRSVVLFLIAALALARASHAQDRLMVEGELGAFGRFGQVIGPGIPNLGGTILVGGGRYAVWGQGNLSYDLRTGRSALQLPPGRLVAGDAARPFVYMARPDGVWRVDAGTGVEQQVDAGGDSGLRNCVVASSSAELYCVFARSLTLDDIVRITPRGRELVASTWILSGFSLGGAPPPAELVVTADGAFLYAMRCDAPLPNAPQFCLRTSVLRLDTRSGAQTAIEATGQMQWDELNQRLFLHEGQNVRVLSQDLADLGSAFVGGRCHTLAVSPHTGRLYLHRMDYYYGPAWSTLAAFNSTTYQRVEADVERRTGSTCDPMVLLTAPGPPRNLQASVTGHVVSLAWENVGGASSFVLEAGATPGSTAVTMSLGADSRLTVPDVPSGTYYLRLRGGNEFGGGRPSPELRVVVP